MTGQTRINVRAVIQKDNEVLLCHFVNKKYFFFPGGGVEFGEGAEGALQRELQEELGEKPISITFIGAVENQFLNDGKPFHELNLLFATKIVNVQAVSKEDDIGFTWMSTADLERENVLPKQLVLAVIRWLKDGKTFWVGLNTE